MNAELLSIGDELLIGQVVNTNASWLGEQFSAAGINVRRVTVVGDGLIDMLNAFARAWEEQDVVVCTGGLGPTHDDVTREAVLQFFSTTLIENSDVLGDIERFMAERGRTMTDTNRDQAMVPASAKIIRNFHGTAPGYHFSQGRKHFYVAPGVPYEMKSMVENYILPSLRGLISSNRATATLLTTGVPESALADILHGIDTLLPDTSVAFLPSPLGVRIRLTGRAEDMTQAEALVAGLADFVRHRASEYIYGTGTDTLEAVIGNLLLDQQKTLAVAESCTGGLITDRITNVPRSSQYFDRGAVVYSNASKTELLGVNPGLIEKYGAVSKEVCDAMADGIRRVSGAGIGIATTGVAGPAGGSSEKPVGLVWIGLSAPDGTWSHAFRFGEDRVRTKQRAAQCALDMLRRYLLSLPVFPSL